MTFFVDIFRDIDNEEEVDSLISDYVLDIKLENSDEFKSDQIPENGQCPKMAEKDSKDDVTSEINEENTEDAADEDEDEVIDNSPDKEMVINAVNDVTGLYFECSTYKKNKDERYKEVLMRSEKKTTNFKFTSLFKEKLTNKIENITNLITKLERD